MKNPTTLKIHIKFLEQQRNKYINLQKKRHCFATAREIETLTQQIRSCERQVKQLEKTHDQN